VLTIKRLATPVVSTTDFFIALGCAIGAQDCEPADIGGRLAEGLLENTPGACCLRGGCCRHNRRPLSIVASSAIPILTTAIPAVTREIVSARTSPLLALGPGFQYLPCHRGGHPRFLSWDSPYLLVIRIRTNKFRFGQMLLTELVSREIRK